MATRKATSRTPSVQSPKKTSARLPKLQPGEIPAEGNGHPISSNKRGASHGKATTTSPDFQHIVDEKPSNWNASEKQIEDSVRRHGYAMARLEEADAIRRIFNIVTEDVSSRLCNIAMLIDKRPILIWP